MMESMDCEQVGPLTSKEPLPLIHLWYLHDRNGIKTSSQEINLKEISVRSLKEIAVHGKQDVCFTTNIDEIDILHNGSVLQENIGLSLEELNIKPNSVLHVTKRLGTISKEKDDMYEVFQKEPSKKISGGIISELVMALKTMILSPSFITTIEKLSDPQMLRNIIAVVPNLQFDSVGIAIIQDPSMILYLADEESLKALSQTHPWIVEALNYISATVHQQEATSSRGGAPGSRSSSLLSYFRQLDEDGDEEEDTPAQPSAAGTITRQQLAAALESFNNLRGLTTGPSGQPPAGNLTSTTRAAPSTPRPRLGTTDPLSLLVPPSGVSSRPSSASSTPPPLTGELVARAMREALTQLPPEQRSAQMNAFRNLAMSLNQQQQQQQATATPAVAPTQQVTAPTNQQYQAEVAQMRDMGILDERLSIMALRVSDGDVATAAELIFSGWNGEGYE